LILLVPGGGLEPPRPCGLRILSPLRLPISPSGPEDGISSILNRLGRRCIRHDETPSGCPETHRYDNASSHR
jgi:hypothetical protein